MSIAISHNMDNIESIKQGDLAKYMGLTKTAAGANATQTDLSDAVSDASNSKRMEVTTNGNIEYYYRRGGVTLKGTIDVPSQKITWEVYGVDTTNTKNRHTALREGLKLANDSDLTVATNALWT